MAGSLTLSEIDRLLAKRQDPTPIRTFVETGTFYAHTILEMKKRFDVCHTIELSPFLYLRARIKFPFSNIHFHYGDSAKVLKKLAKKIKEPAVFFLDAHWCAGNTARGPKDVPLLEEMQILAARPYPDLLIIDDYRLFGTHQAEDWTDITHERVMQGYARKSASAFVENDRLIVG
jgi:hypothetical protein